MSEESTESNIERQTKSDSDEDPETSTSISSDEDLDEKKEEDAIELTRVSMRRSKGKDKVDDGLKGSRNGMKSSFGGKLRGAEISFENLTMNVKVTGGKLKDKLLGIIKPSKRPSKDLIKGIYGTLHKGRLIAIMGPSGAGKTTLLSILSNRVQDGKHGTRLKGSLLVNGQKMKYLNDRYRENVGFVMQDDVMLSNLTPREQLKFSAYLRLSRDIPHKEKKQRVEDLLRSLVLTKASNTRVGLAGIQRGVSGGERKRTAIGVELVNDPQILFLDEPTSGLDSTTALTVVKILRTLAHDHGTTVITTIHQPSSQIFYTFDDLFLLSEGHLIYGGPVKDCVPHFSRLGYKCPNLTNPADFMLDLASPAWRDRSEFKRRAIKQQEEEGLEEDDAIIHSPVLDHVDETELDKVNREVYDEDIEKLIRAYADQYQIQENKPADYVSVYTTDKTTGNQTKATSQSNPNFFKSLISSKREAKHFHLNEHNKSAFAHKKKPFFWTQFLLLLWRQTLQTSRDPKATYVGLIGTIIQSIFIGLIFLQLSLDQSGVQNRLGAMFLIMMSTFFTQAQGALTSFPLERPLFLREYGARIYAVGTYYLAKSLVDLPTTLILFPALFVTITYWMIGYNHNAGHFFIWLIILVILANIAQGLGMSLSAGLDLDQALILMPMITIPFALLGGFFLNPSNTPSWLIWLQYLSPFYWAFQGLVLNEFDGQNITCDDNQRIVGPDGMMKCPIASADDLLNSLDLNDVSIWRTIVVLISYFIFLKALAFVLLWIVAKRRSANA